MLNKQVGFIIVGHIWNRLIQLFCWIDLNILQYIAYLPCDEKWVVSPRCWWEINLHSVYNCEKGLLSLLQFNHIVFFFHFVRYQFYQAYCIIKNYYLKRKNSKSYGGVFWINWYSIGLVTEILQRMGAYLWSHWFDNFIKLIFFSRRKNDVRRSVFSVFGSWNTTMNKVKYLH